MKLRKFLISVMCVLLTTLMAVPTFAAPKQDIVYINPIYEGVVTRSMVLANTRGAAAPLEVSYDPADYLEYDEAVASMREQMVQRVETVTVWLRTDSAPTQELFSHLFEDAIAHTGVPDEGDYIHYTLGGYSAKMTDGWGMGGSYYLPITYTPLWYTTAAQEAEMDDAVDALLAELDLGDATDYEKAVGVYDYICSNVTYDYDNLDNEAYTLKFSAYAALMDKTAVCQGYASLLYRLMLELGVDCRVISGDGGGPHGWNIVEMEGLYYNADSTWDAGVENWRYFLVCPSNFTDHVRNAEFDTPEFHAAYPMGVSDYEPLSHTHTYTSAVTPPTCTEQGYTTYTCDCGDSYVDSYTDPTGEHSYTAGVCVWCGRSKLGGEWLVPDFAQGDYTMVVLPDTQILVERWPEVYYNQMQWIADHKDTLNIQAVLHMGDMVNTNNDTQWTVCEAGTDILDATGIPWMPMRGNHDDSAWFNRYYDYATYGTNQSWFGGSYHADKLEHTYWFVTVGEREYLILSLGWAPNWDVLDWAKGIVEGHSDKNVILACHAYINKDGTLLDAGDSHCVSSYYAGYPNGDDVWNAFKEYKNIVLAMGGHIHSPDVVTFVDKNGDGRDVTSLLFDRQNDDSGSRLGMVGVLTFHGDSDAVDINWYSTRYDALYREKNQFSISVPHLCDHGYTVETAEATCTRGGGTRYTCTICGHSYVEGATDPLGHDYVETVTPPTCTEPGYTMLTCSRCGESSVKTVQTEITDRFVWLDQKMIIATDGQIKDFSVWIASEFTDISDCDKLIIKTANTASKDSNVGFAFYDANKNYISGLIHTDKSGVYGVLIHETEVPENAVYIRTTWYSKSHPNYVEEFGEFYCIGTMVDAIAPTGHNYQAVVTPPTCTEQGYTTYTCSCGDSCVGDYVDALGHDYSVGLCDICAHDGVSVTAENGILTITSDELEEGTLLYLAAYDEYGRFLSMKKIIWNRGEWSGTLPRGEEFKLMFVDSNWTPLRTALDI